MNFLNFDPRMQRSHFSRFRHSPVCRTRLCSSNNAYNMPVNSPELRTGQLPQYWVQETQPKQCHLQSFSPTHLDYTLNAHSHWPNVDHGKVYSEVGGQSLQKPSQLPQSHMQISQFNNCGNFACKTCGPVRQSFLNRRISSGLVCEPCPVPKVNVGYQKRKVEYLLGNLHPGGYIIQDSQPTAKRMKVDNHDDWSLATIVAPFLKQQVGQLLYEEDNVKRMNTDLLSFEEAPVTAVTWNVTADAGKFISPDACYNKIANLKGLGQPPEDCINSNAMEWKGLHTSDETIMGNEVAMYHPEMINMVDEQSPEDCMNSNALERKGLHTSDDTHDNYIMGNEDAMSHTDILNMVDELLNMVDGKSFEDCMDSNALERKGLHTSDETHINYIMGNEDAMSHPEMLNMVDEQSKRGCIKTSDVKGDVTLSCLSSDGFSVHPEEGHEEVTQTEHDSREAMHCLANTDHHFGRKLEDSKVSGVSLIDFFTADQIKAHLSSLNQRYNMNAEKDLSGSTCQLCTKGQLEFAAPAKDCASCGAQIKHKATYYWSQDVTGPHCCFCSNCFRNSRGGHISFGGRLYQKVTLNKEKNTEEYPEPWVQCDDCAQWQHQICALYNCKEDLKGKAKYICPFCRLAQIESHTNMSIPRATGAWDLPRTKLSGHIEQRLLRSLKQEREMRADALGKHPEEVPEASDLTVRVVSAVNKQLEVKQQFLDIFPNKNYPTEFPYTSKVILLFQKIEGADVCLFAMYVQEFGSECENPNKRSVYISYLDSVKYFRPEIKAITGAALRTFVYHEILIGYLDYCKQCGFVSCYIWSCPSLRGNDYILNCHPENQKRPNSNKLIHWYKKMLKKAKGENVVVDFTTFYEYFFVPSGNSNCKITAARLPYFDGDYWSSAIEEDILKTIEENSRRYSERQSRCQRAKRTCKAMGHSDLSVDATKDILVMEKLEQRILPMKEDIIVVHLQFKCTNCDEAILSGGRWSCNQCRNFHLCGRCLQLKRFPSGLETHNIHGEEHQLYLFPENVDLAAASENKDDILDNNNVIDDRYSFLKFCQESNYQFDTLRRAKHSTMMMLHQLNASTAKTMGTICSLCHQDNVVGLNCEICEQFHVCNDCYEKRGDGCHDHKLVMPSTIFDPGKTSEETQQQDKLWEELWAS